MPIDLKDIPTHQDIIRALSSTEGRVRLRDENINILMRRRPVVEIYSVTVRESERGRGLMWHYLEKIERIARARGAFAIHLDGILLTTRMKEKATDHGYFPTTHNSMIKVL